MSNLVDKLAHKSRKEFKGPFDFCPLCGGRYDKEGVCRRCKTSHFKAAQRFINFYDNFVPGEYSFI